MFRMNCQCRGRTKTDWKMSVQEKQGRSGNGVVLKAKCPSFLNQFALDTLTPIKQKKKIILKLCE